MTVERPRPARRSAELDELVDVAVDLQTWTGPVFRPPVTLDRIIRVAGP